MRSRSARLSSCIVLLVAASAGCYSPAGDEGDEGALPIACATAPTFVESIDSHCSTAERTLIFDAWFNVVQPQMCQSAPRAALSACLREARLSPPREAFAEEIMRRLQQNLPTRIQCKTLATNINAQAPVGVAAGDPESLTFNHRFLADDNLSLAGNQPPTAARVASVLLHEVAHNKGYTHYSETGEEYDHSVNEQVEVCSRRLATGVTALPHGAARERSARQETELQPFGDPGDSDGARFFHQCPPGTVLSGQQVAVNLAGVTGVRMWCRSPTGTVATPVGIGPDTGLGAQSMCPSGYVAVGVQARATGTAVRSLGLHCRRWSDVAASSDSATTLLPVPANPTLPPPLPQIADLSVRRMCPPGMYVSALAGSLDGAMEHLRVWCTTPAFGAGGVWNNTVDDITFDAVPSSARRSHEERCTENGALTGLFGSTRGGQLVRMGGYCQGLRATATGYQMLGEHLLPTGGDGPTSDTFEARCPTGRVAVGFRARGGIGGNGVMGLNLVCSTMQSASLLSEVSVMGTMTGTNIQTRMCPPHQRLVGIRASSASYGLPLPLGRIVDRLAPICRAFAGS